MFNYLQPRFRRHEVVLGAAGQVAFRRDSWDWQDSSGRPLFVRRHRTWKPFARNWMLYFAKKSAICRQAAQGDLNGKARLPTVTQGLPKGTQRDSKVDPARGNGRRMTPKREQQITNLYTNGPNIQTSDLPPYSSRLV